MKTKIAFYGILFLAVNIITAQQKEVNNYKYIIVPNKFDFVKKPDQYNTSSLTKFLFSKKGFTAFLNTEELPEDLNANRCLALIGRIKDKSGIFTTKSLVEMVDCSGKVIFRSDVGKSKEKEYQKAYHEAIRDAFNSVKDLKYKKLKESAVANVAFSNDVKKVKKEVANNDVLFKKEKSAVKKNSSSAFSDKKEITKNILYPKPRVNGYQLVNIKAKVVFELLNTDNKDVFVIKGKNGILYKNGSFWVAEFYQRGKKVIKKYKVKF